VANWFSSRLISWYRANRRDLPWRNETDPYKIWISEVILQQTQVAQGLAYYNAFTERFPDVKALAAAGEDDVLKQWQGLGYYSRARNLHAAAKQVCSEFNGVFPSEPSGLRKLRGVGEYTAAAVASIAFNKPAAVVDGNVYRVLSRFFGLAVPIDSTTGKKVFSELASRLLDHRQPGTCNQAVMEFGALHCRPVSPSCPDCPLQVRCAAFAEGKVNALPVRSRKTAIRQRHLNYFVIGDRNGRVKVRRREESDIWKGLYEFCLVETASPQDPAKLMASKDVKPLLQRPFGIKHVSRVYDHQLTHQRLSARFYVVSCDTEFHPSESLRAVDLGTLAFPRLITRFLEQHDLSEIL
jgi:A/G-specific adenine glycosylase